MAAWGLRCCAKAFFRCSKQGPLSSCGVRAPLAVGHGLEGL